MPSHLDRRRFPHVGLLGSTGIAVALFLGCVPRGVAQAPPHGLRVPPGFEVTEFADSTLANNIYCMTLDPKGRVVVSGPGYVRLLVDEHGAAPLVLPHGVPSAGPPAS